MVSGVVSRTDDCGFEPSSSQIKDYNIGISCFSTYHLEIKTNAGCYGIGIMSLNRNTSPCGQLSFSGITLYKKQISSHLHVPFSPRDITETSVICRQQESPIHLFMYHGCDSTVVGLTFANESLLQLQVFRSRPTHGELQSITIYQN
jgi:hypothetical protein